MNAFKCFKARRQELEAAALERLMDSDGTHVQIVYTCGKAEMRAMYSRMLRQFEFIEAYWPDGRQSCFFLANLSLN